MIYFLKRLKNKKGFTLVEILVVIAIIGILAAVLVPLMNNFLRNARISNAESTAYAAANCVNVWLVGETTIREKGINVNALDTLTAIPNGAGGWNVSSTNASAWHAGTNAEAGIKSYLDETFPDADIGEFFIVIQRGSSGSWDFDADVAVAFIPNNTVTASAVGAAASVVNRDDDRFSGVTAGIGANRIIVGCYPPQ